MTYNRLLILAINRFYSRSICLYLYVVNNSMLLNLLFWIIYLIFIPQCRTLISRNIKPNLHQIFYLKNRGILWFCGCHAKVNVVRDFVMSQISRNCIRCVINWSDLITRTLFEIHPGTFSTQSFLKTPNLSFETGRAWEVNQICCFCTLVDCKHLWYPLSWICIQYPRFLLCFPDFTHLLWRKSVSKLWWRDILPVVTLRFRNRIYTLGFPRPVGVHDC